MKYERIAKEARRKVLEMIHKAGTSHIGSNFSSIDILAVLFELMDIKKDEFIASKGWIAASVYYFLAEKGVIPKKDLERFCMPGEEEYIGLIEPRGKFGLRFAGGSMCLGLAAGVGYALSKKLRGEPGQVYVLESDGGMNGGPTWEALAIAAQHKLGNLTLIVDSNKLQAMGSTEGILDMEPLVKKILSFNWECGRVDGHNYGALENTLRIRSTMPRAVVADTIKGKGVSFMEGQNLYHYAHVSAEDYKEALKEIG